MIPDTYRPLFDRLYERTIAGEVNWKQTANENTLAIHVSDFTLTVSRDTDYHGNEEFVRWELLNEQGKEIDSFVVSERENDWTEASDFYDRARRKAIRLDEALATIMKELEESRPVGGEPKKSSGKRPAPSPFDSDDDDLPF